MVFNTVTEIDSPPVKVPKPAMTCGSMHVPCSLLSQRYSAGEHWANVRIEHATAMRAASVMGTTQRKSRCHRKSVILMIPSRRAETEILPAATPMMPNGWLSQLSNNTVATLSGPVLTTSSMCSRPPRWAYKVKVMLQPRKQS